MNKKLTITLLAILILGFLYLIFSKYQTFKITNNSNVDTIVPVSFKVVDASSGFGIENYTLKINGQSYVGENSALKYLATLPDGKYDYTISANGYNDIKSDLTSAFIKADVYENDLPKIQVNMPPIDTKAWDSKWSSLVKNAESKGEGLILGFISTPDYQPLPGVSISSDESSYTTTTNQNGYFEYYYKLPQDVVCPTLHIKSDGYEEIQISEYSGSRLTLRLKAGTGIDKREKSRSCE